MHTYPTPEARHQEPTPCSESMENVQAQLRRHLSSVLSKQAGQTVALCGHLGSGKTFTLESLLKNAPCKHLHLSASLSEIEIIESLPNFKSLHDPRTPRGTLAKQLAALAPFVLVLENLHELCTERLEFVKQLASLIPKLRGVGLFVTSRSEVPSPFKHYWLEPLNYQEVTTLLEGRANGNLPHEGLEWVFAKSKGNPLFALEFWRYLRQGGYFWSDGSHWHWRVAPEDFVPPTVRAILQEWLIQVAKDETVKQVLEVRALLPESVCKNVWMQGAGLGPHTFCHAHYHLENAGLLGKGECVHPLVAQIIQENMPAKERSLYAERALTALEKAGLEPSATLIASANLEKNQSLELYKRLANAAKTNNDSARAGHWLALAAEGSQGIEQFQFALEAAHLLRYTDVATATHVAQLAASLPPHDEEAVFLCAELWMTQGETQRAEAALQLLPSEKRLGQRWWETMIRLYYTGHVNCDETLRLWRSRPDLQKTAYPEITLFVATILGQSGRFTEAHALANPLLSCDDLEPFLRCRILGLHGILAYLQGDFTTSEFYELQAITLARTLNRPAYLAQLLRNYAIDAESFNNYTLAATHYREALTIYREQELTLEVAFTQTLLAQTLSDLGDYQEAETLLLESQRILERSDNTLYQCQCHGSLAALYLEWQPPYGGTLALKHANATLSLAQKVNHQEMIQAGFMYCARAEAWCGNAQKALELGHAAIQEQVTGPSSVRQAWGALAWGLALEVDGKREEAVQVIAEASQQLFNDKMDKLAQRYGLEVDRLTQNLGRARERHAWFKEQGLQGGAKVALRYFPSLEAAESTPGVEKVSPRLDVLGPAQLEKDGKCLPYRGRKRLELLTFLLETRMAGRAEATLLNIMDALYPDTGEAESKAVIKQLVYLLRNQLGGEAIVSTPNGYALGNLQSDAERFLETHDMTLWRGAYLSGLENWYPEVREILLQHLEQEVLKLLTTHPKEAARLARLWLEMEPYDLQPLRLLLQACETSGEVKVAEKLYQESRKRMLEVGETLPGSRAEFLASSAQLSQCVTTM
jgi:tetratricopeptide (TPR) repeat protein